MSFFGEMLVKAAVKKVEDITMREVVNYMENTRSVDALINATTSNYVLLIKKKSISIKRSFAVFSESGEKKYCIKTDAITFGYPCIRLYDISEKEIGKVELTSKTDMGVYSMFLDGRKLGTVIRKKSIKIKLDIELNGWYLEGNFMKNSFTVTDENGSVVMKFSDAYDSRDTYVLELNHREHEVLGIMLVMVVEIALHSNG